MLGEIAAESGCEMLTETEEEAHGLLKRQIERLIPSSNVVMLNRNNSADRLQATTHVAAASERSWMRPRLWAPITT
jgi:hypothetical protein